MNRPLTVVPSARPGAGEFRNHALLAITPELTRAGAEIERAQGQLAIAVRDSKFGIKRQAVAGIQAALLASARASLEAHDRLGAEAARQAAAGEDA